MNLTELLAYTREQHVKANNIYHTVKNHRAWMHAATVAEALGECQRILYRTYWNEKYNAADKDVERHLARWELVRLASGAAKEAETGRHPRVRHRALTRYTIYQTTIKRLEALEG